MSMSISHIFFSRASLASFGNGHEYKISMKCSQLGLIRLALRAIYNSFKSTMAMVKNHPHSALVREYKCPFVNPQVRQFGKHGMNESHADICKWRG